MAELRVAETGTNENPDMVIKALTEKLGSAKLICPLSQDSNWEVQYSFAAVPAFNSYPPPPVPEKSFPLAVLVCKTCGYTFFVNLITLGLADQLGLPVSND